MEQLYAMVYSIDLCIIELLYLGNLVVCTPDWSIESYAIEFSLIEQCKCMYTWNHNKFWLLDARTQFADECHSLKYELFVIWMIELQAMSYRMPHI